MRRLARHLFTFCSAVSLLLCVAACGLWARSYFVGDALHDGWVNDPPTSGTYLQAYSNRGAISLRRWDVTAQGDARALSSYRVDGFIQIDRPEHWTTGEPELWPLARYRWMMGFYVHDGSMITTPAPGVSQVERDRSATLPHWLPMLAAGVLPAVWWRRHRLHRTRRHAGLCVACGYDLRASPGRCPECGTPAKGVA